ncbi:ATP-binding cassette domain-containing protein [Bacteroidota bacterium]
MVEFSDLQHTYDQQKTLSFHDWNVSHGQHGVIYGNSGSGKSTLIGLISGLIQVQSGILTVCDENLKILSVDERDAFRGKNIGMVFHKPYLSRILNVYDNLAYAQQFSGKTEDDTRIFELLKEINLSDKAFSRVSEITDAEARQIAIARAILHSPRLILVDEPVAGLDMKEGKQIIDLLIGQAGKHEASLIIATNDIRIRDVFKNQLNLKN